MGVWDVQMNLHLRVLYSPKAASLRSSSFAGSGCVFPFHNTILIYGLLTSNSSPSK